MLRSRGLSLIRSSFARQASWVLAGNVGNKAVMFLVVLFLSRILGPERYGLYVLALSILSITLELSDLGLSSTAVRYASEYSSRGERDKLHATYSILIWIRLVIGFLACGAGFLLCGWLAENVFRTPEVTPYLRVAFLGVVGLLLHTIFISFLEADQRFAARAQVLVVSGVLQALLLLAFWSTNFLNITQALAAYALAPFLASFLAARIATLRPGTLRRWDSEIAGKLFAYGKWMILWGLAVALQNRLDTWMLTRLATTGEVGVYNAAYRISMVATLLPGAVSTVAIPRLVASTASGSMGRESKRLFWASSCLAIGLVLFSFLAPPLVTLFLGESYEAGGTALTILLWGWAIFAFNLPFATYLNTIEKPQVMAVAAVLSLVQTYLMNLVLIPYYGIDGAAFSFVSALALVNLSCVGGCLFYRRRLREEPECREEIE